MTEIGVNMVSERDKKRNSGQINIVISNQKRAPVYKEPPVHESMEKTIHPQHEVLMQIEEELE